MIYEVIWHTPSTDKVDLVDYGHSDEVVWSDLSDDEQNEILDSLREQQINMVRNIKKVD